MVRKVAEIDFSLHSSPADRLVRLCLLSTFPVFSPPSVFLMQGKACFTLSYYKLPSRPPHPNIQPTYLPELPFDSVPWVKGITALNVPSILIINTCITFLSFPSALIYCTPALLGKVVSQAAIKLWLLTDELTSN